MSFYAIRRCFSDRSSSAMAFKNASSDKKTRQQSKKDDFKQLQNQLRIYLVLSNRNTNMFTTIDFGRKNH
jgi:hypothetical protein